MIRKTNMIIIAIGSNLAGKWADTPQKMCLEATHKISLLPYCYQPKISSWYKTSPIPASSQPFYINGIMSFQGNVDPFDLLHKLNQLEAEAGRKRSEPNAARALDLDIIAIDNQIIQKTPQLVVPHPRAHERGFVLYPLRDLFPDWVHPVYKKSVSQLIADLPVDQLIEKVHVD